MRVLAIALIAIAALLISGCTSQLEKGSTSSSSIPTVSGQKAATSDPIEGTVTEKKAKNDDGEVTEAGLVEHEDTEVVKATQDIGLEPERAARGLLVKTKYLLRIRVRPEPKSPYYFRVLPGTKLYVKQEWKHGETGAEPVDSAQEWAKVLLPKDQIGYVLKKQITGETVESTKAVASTTPESTVTTPPEVTPTSPSVWNPPPSPPHHGTSYTPPPQLPSVSADGVVSATSDVVDDVESLKRAVDVFSDGYTNWKEVVEDASYKLHALISSVDDLESQINRMSQGRRYFSSEQSDAYSEVVRAHNDFVDELDAFTRVFKGFSDGYSEWKEVVDDVERKMRLLGSASDDLESAAQDLDSAFGG